MSDITVPETLLWEDRKTPPPPEPTPEEEDSKQVSIPNPVITTNPSAPSQTAITDTKKLESLGVTATEPTARGEQLDRQLSTIVSLNNLPRLQANSSEGNQSLAQRLTLSGNLAAAARLEGIISTSSQNTEEQRAEQSQNLTDLQERVKALRTEGEHEKANQLVEGYFLGRGVDSQTGREELRTQKIQEERSQQAREFQGFITGMSDLKDNLDRSAAAAIINTTLTDILKRRDNLNPESGSALPFDSKSSPKIFELPSEELPSLENYGADLNRTQRQQEITDRLTLNETLSEQREGLLRTQGNASLLMQAGRPDLVHELFNEQGKPLSQDSVNNNEELSKILNRDQKLESDFAAMSESILGLSPEEQLVRAREHTTEGLKEDGKLLRSIDQQNQALQVLIANPSIGADMKLAFADQIAINNIASQAIERRADFRFALHDQLTENLNQGNYDEGLKTIKAAEERIATSQYTQDDPKLSGSEVRSRDLSVTPDEVKALEQKFEEMSKGISGIASSVLAHAIRLNEENSSIINGNPINSRTIQLAAGAVEQNDRIADASQESSGTILDNLRENQTRFREAQERFAETGQLQEYGQNLKEIIDSTEKSIQETGTTNNPDKNGITKGFEKLDNFYQNLETTAEVSRNVAVIAAATAATIATGGAVAPLLANYGLSGLALTSVASVTAGTAAGTGIGLASNTAEGVSRQIHGFQNPYADVLNKTYQDFKTSAVSSVATITGMQATKFLAETAKWSRMASSVTGSATSGFASTNTSYSIAAVEQLATEGKISLSAEKYISDLMWNMGSSTLGGAIGARFDQMKDTAGLSQMAKLGLDLGEEATSATADLLTTQLREGEITSEGLLETLQSSITGRLSSQAGYDAANTRTTQQATNELAQSIRSQDISIKTSSELADGIDGQTKVTVNPDGSRRVEVKLSDDLVAAAARGDKEAQKKLIEESYGHARENPIDPLVKQADGSYKAMDPALYDALRARQELVQRSVGAAKAAQAEGESASVAKADTKDVIQEITQHIKSGNYSDALKLAEQQGIDEVYRGRFQEDYEHNTHRDRETEALEQTNYSAGTLNKPRDSEQQKDLTAENQEQFIETLKSIQTQQALLKAQGTRIGEIKRELNETRDDKKIQELKAELDQIQKTKESTKQKTDPSTLKKQQEENGDKFLSNLPADLSERQKQLTLKKIREEKSKIENEDIDYAEFVKKNPAIGDRTLADVMKDPGLSTEERYAQIKELEANYKKNKLNENRFYQKLNEVEKRITDFDLIPPLTKSLAQELSNSNNLGLKGTLDLAEKISNIERIVITNKNLPEELRHSTNQFLKDVLRQAHIPGSNTLIDNVHGKLSSKPKEPGEFNLNDPKTYGKLYGFFNEAKGNLSHLGQGNLVEISRENAPEGHASLITQDGVGLIDGSLTGDALRQSLVDHGFAIDGNRLGGVKSNGKDMVINIDFEQGKLLDASGREVMLNQRPDGSIQPLEIDAVIKTDTGELYLEHKIQLSTILSKNLGADYSLQNIGKHLTGDSLKLVNQMQNQMNVAKAHGKEYGIQLDVSNASPYQKLVFESALRSLLNHPSGNYSNMVVRIFDKNGVDITNNFDLK